MTLSLAIALVWPDSADIRPTVSTEPVAHDPDDPAIWYDAADPQKSLVVGTDKIEEVGAIYVYDLKGRIRQKIAGLDRPNNVDIEYGVEFAGRRIDIAVVTERKKRRLLIYRIDSDRRTLVDVTGNTQVFLDRSGEGSEPMGVGLYRTRGGNAVAFVSPKTGPRDRYLGKYELVEANGRFDLRPLGAFGSFSGLKEIESVFVDDRRGRVYYSDEKYGLMVYNIDSPIRAAKVVPCSHYLGDNEGVAVWESRRTLVSCEQVLGGSYLNFYELSDHSLAARLKTVSDETDGIDVCSRPMGAMFPEGLLVMMDSGLKRFQFYGLRDVRLALNRR